MQFKSKKTIVGMAVALVLFIGYIFYALSSSAPADGDLEGWALLMLKFILACVIAEVIAQILIHIILAASVTYKEKDESTVKKIIDNEMVEDEMDKQITLKSSHVGYGVVGVGFVLTLIAIAFLDVSAILALNIMLGVFFLSAMADTCVSVYMYEVGENWCCDCK